MRWGMVIDLKVCSACQTCVASCKLGNFLPVGIFWNRVHDYEIGEYPAVRREFLPVLCMHCKSPACVDVCPTGASIKREDGIVYIDYDRCIGCKYCVVSCPYQARAFYPREAYYYDEPTIREKLPYELRTRSQRFKIGTTTKCNFCMDRIDAGLERGLKPGVDPEATPICVTTCPANGRFFGDLDEPNSEVSRLIRNRRGYRILEELGTEPSVWYLPR